MKRHLLEIYALAVCFFTVACFVIVAGMALWGIFRIVAPDLTVPGHIYEQHLSEQSYQRMTGRFAAPVSIVNEDGSTRALAAPRPPAELSRADSWALALRAERREGMRSIVRNAIIIFIDVLVFGFHWRIARRERATE